MIDEKRTVEENKPRRYCLWEEWGVGLLREAPRYSLKWLSVAYVRTWRRSGRCISVVAMEGTKMFTTKPEAGEKITKLGGGEPKTPFTERPATYASRSQARVRARSSRRFSART